MALDSETMDDLLADSLQLETQLRQEESQQLFYCGDLSQLVQQFKDRFLSLTESTQFQLFRYSNLHLGQLERYSLKHQEQEEDTYV